jgi:large subunit ribosomal protein L20
MPRSTRGAVKAQKHKKVLKKARGHVGAGSRRYRVAIQVLLHAGENATRDRRKKKRDFRGLWITRISAACRSRGLTYSRFMNALAEAGVQLNRKMLSEMAIADPATFDKLYAIAREKAPSYAKAAVIR